MTEACEPTSCSHMLSAMHAERYACSEISPHTETFDAASQAILSESLSTIKSWSHFCERHHLKTGWTEAGLCLVSLPSLGGLDPLIMLLDRLAGILLPKAGIWRGESGRTSSGCDPFMASRAVCVKLR